MKKSISFLTQTLALLFFIIQAQAAGDGPRGWDMDGWRSTGGSAKHAAPAQDLEAVQQAQLASIVEPFVAWVEKNEKVDQARAKEAVDALEDWMRFNPTATLEELTAAVAGIQEAFSLNEDPVEPGAEARGELPGDGANE